MKRKRIFMGSTGGHSQALELFMQLGDALTRLQEIQQPPQFESSPTKEEIKKFNQQLEDEEEEIEYAAKLIAEGLTGKEVIFKN